MTHELPKRGTYDGWPLLEATHDNFMVQGGAVNGPCYYVWPVEGEWKGKKFVFHKGSYMDGDTEIPYPDGPLMVDASSARGYKLIYDALNDKNKAKTRELAEEHRGMFVFLMDKIVWPNISFGGRARG